MNINKMSFYLYLLIKRICEGNNLTTLKDHTEDFNNDQPIRLINPVKKTGAYKQDNFRYGK